MIFVRLGTRFKRFVWQFLRGPKKPPERTMEWLRRFKPDECPCCHSSRLQGHGWRCRSVLTSFRHWGNLWYLRVRCPVCRVVLRVVFDVALPELLYGAEVVLEVVVGRLKGEPSGSFAPHARTQKRWLDRFEHWWPEALAAGAIEGALEQWARGVGGLREALHRCARLGVWLVLASHAALAKSTPCGRFRRPVVTTHQPSPLLG